MKPDRTTWIFTAALFLLAAAFTVFIGLTVARMNGRGYGRQDTESEEARSQADNTSREDTKDTEAEKPSDTEPVTDTREEEPSSVPEPDTEKDSEPDTPVPSDTEPVPDDGLYRDGVIRALKPEELTEIESRYSTEERSYWVDPNRDGENRPAMNVTLNAEFIEKFGEGHVRIFAPGEMTQALSFVLVTEYDMNTSYILDTLKENGVHAVFYIASAYAVQNPGIIERILAEGHELGSIGAQQDVSFSSLPLDRQMEEALRVQQYIYDTYEYAIKKFFFSFNSFSDASIALLNRMGYTVCFYSGSYNDLDHDTVMNSDEFLNGMLSQLHSGMISFLHTTNTATIVMLPEFIREAEARGYHFTGF